MQVVAPTPSGQLLPFELKLLEAAATTLSSSDVALFSKQVACINKVQRLLDWKEIEFYRMRWFRARWPEEVLFADKSEIRIATIQCEFGSKKTSVDVWAVGGHIFSLESPVGFSGLSISGPLTVGEVRAGT